MNTTRPLPRSPAGLLAGKDLEEDVFAGSPSSQSNMSLSASPLRHPKNLKRRSTAETQSSGLDYYWSSIAGVGPSSSTSSLAISPSPSLAIPLVSPSSVHSPLSPAALQARLRSRSTVNLREDMRDVGSHSSRLDQLGVETLRPPLPQQYSSGSVRSEYSISAAGPSSRRLHTFSFSSVSDLHDERDLDSPASLSSQYSSGHSRAHGLRTSDEGHVEGYRGEFGSDEGERRRALLEPSTVDRDWQERHGRFDEIRGSIASGSTVRPESTEVFEDVPWTPVPPPIQERPELLPPTFSYDSPKRRSTEPVLQTTPTRSAGSSASGSVYSLSSRHGSVAPLNIPRRSMDALDRRGRSDQRGGMGDLEGSEPKSAPAWRREFGDLNRDEAEGEETITARQGGTLSVPVEQSEPAHEKSRRNERGSRSGPSPEPPPRSALRASKMNSTTPELVGTTTPLNLSPRSHNTESDVVPIITHTLQFPDSISTSRRPSRETLNPQASASTDSHPSIAELADMLGGAIDAIGLIDSRDTPPPTMLEPSPKEKSFLLASPLTVVERKVVESQPQITSAFPTRQRSLSGQMGEAPQPRRTTSIPSIRSVKTLQSISLPSSKPWPAAMLYGSVKTLKTPGERTKGYAKLINDLSAADSGLKEWCIAAGIQAHRPSIRVSPSRKMSSFTSLGVRPDAQSSRVSIHSLHPGPHPRNVSASSEFPMREDSYTAREISQRHIDPSDQPTALPANLPYPQLQQQIRSGMKPSPSMQSVASTASTSTKKGFFSAMRKSGKKDSLTLGPPLGGGGAPKKDVRGLSISGPTVSQTDPSALPARLQSSVAAPLGPRGMRMGSQTPPPTIPYDRASIDIPRGSLDTGLSRMTPPTIARASFDSTRTNKSSAPPRSSPMASGANSTCAPGTPRDEDVRAMGDILPHVEKGVIRTYLARYGEQMQAIGAYLEDEKRGTVMRN